MATLERVARVRIDDAATHAVFRQWIATAAALTTPAGGAVVIDVAMTTGGAVPPGAAQTLELRVVDEAGATVRTFALNPALANQQVTFHFTATGQAGAEARADTFEIVLRAIRTDLGTYDVESDGAPNQPGAGNDSHLDRGWINASVNCAMVLSNIAQGGAKTEPMAYGDTLHVRATLAARPVVNRTLTLRVGNPVVMQQNVAGATAQFQHSFAPGVDNRFATALTPAVPVSAIAGNSALTGQPFVVLGVVGDSADIDPRHTVDVQAQPSTPRSDGANRLSYLILADQLFVWARARTARGDPIAGLTMTQRLRNGAAVVKTDATKVTGADGWTPAAGAEFTDAVVLPQGQRIQEAFASAPANATGLGTGDQILGFSSAYTANRRPALRAPDEVEPDELVVFVCSYRDDTGGRLAFDVAPVLRIYATDPDTGDDTDLLPEIAMERIGATEEWRLDWQAEAEGTYRTEVRGVFLGAGVLGVGTITVRRRQNRLDRPGWRQLTILAP